MINRINMTERAKITVLICQHPAELWQQRTGAEVAKLIETNCGLIISPTMARDCVLSVYPQLKRKHVKGGKENAVTNEIKSLEQQVAELSAKLDKLTQMATGKLL